MSKNSASSGKKQPKLSPSQIDSPDTLSAEELALRRAQSAAEAVERNRRQGIELLSQGAQLLRQGRPDEAARKLERAVLLLPDDADAAINLGGAYILQKRYNKAVQILERASQLAADNPMVWTNLAAAYLGNLELSGPQQQSKAIAAYEKALQFDPAAPNVHYNLGLIYRDRQDWPLAKAYFLQALQVDRSDADARHWLEWLAQVEHVQDSAAPDQESSAWAAQTA